MKLLQAVRGFTFACVHHCVKRPLFQRQLFLTSKKNLHNGVDTLYQAGFVRHISGVTDDEYSKLAEKFQSDPAVKKWISEMRSDFHEEAIELDKVENENTSGEPNDGIVFEDLSDSSSDSDNDISSDSESSAESDSDLAKDESSFNEIENKKKIASEHDYIIVDDGVVYDYEELHEGYREIEEDVQHVQLPITFERGKSGVFDLDELVSLIQFENGLDICVIAMPTELQYVDYMLLTSAKSNRHCKAMAASVKWCYKKKRGKKDPASIPIEGLESGSFDWLAMDLDNIALHIFMPETRKLYDLETLWTVGPEFDENTQKTDKLSNDPFEVYLRDFGRDVYKATDDTQTILQPETDKSGGKAEIGITWHKPSQT